MELRHLRSLVTLAREGNFTRAARRLRIAQPALSQQIRSLERELGVLLVARTNRTSGLTEAGARLVARAEGILLSVQDATQEMRTHAGVTAVHQKSASSSEATAGRLHRAARWEKGPLANRSNATATRSVRSARPMPQARSPRRFRRKP